MKLLGRDINARALLERVEGQLRARGLLERGDEVLGGADDGRDPLAVEPLSFNLTALERHADPLAPLRPANLVGRVLRGLARPVLEAALGTQRTFNGHVRDSYAQLSAEVLRLRDEVAALEREKAARSAPPPGSQDRARGPTAGSDARPRGRGSSGRQGTPSVPAEGAAPRRAPKKPAKKALRRSAAPRSPKRR